MINELVDYSVYHMQNILNGYNSFRYWVDADTNLFTSTLSMKNRHLFKFNIHALLLDDSFKKDYIIYFLTTDNLYSHTGVNLFYVSNDKYDFDEEIDIYFVFALIENTLVALIIDERSIKANEFGIHIIQNSRIIRSQRLPMNYYTSTIINKLLYPIDELLIIDKLMQKFDSYRFLLQMTKA